MDSLSLSEKAFVFSVSSNHVSLPLCGGKNYNSLHALCAPCIPYRVVRHQNVSTVHLGRRDRFRLNVWGGGRGGLRVVWAELREGLEPPQEKGGVPPAPPAQPVRGILPPELNRPKRGEDCYLALCMM